MITVQVAPFLLIEYDVPVLILTSEAFISQSLHHCHLFGNWPSGCMPTTFSLQSSKTTSKPGVIRPLWFCSPRSRSCSFIDSAPKHAVFYYRTGIDRPRSPPRILKTFPILQDVSAYAFYLDNAFNSGLWDNGNNFVHSSLLSLSGLWSRALARLGGSRVFGFQMASLLPCWNTLVYRSVCPG